MKHLKVILFIIIYLNLRIFPVLGCKLDWDNTCVSNEDCCSGNCDNDNGLWKFGVCKLGRGHKPVHSENPVLSTQSNFVCIKDWSNTCRNNIDCCSGNCDNNSGAWAYGICKPALIIIKEEEKVEESCKEDWFDGCKKNEDCCSNICDKNAGIWQKGVCKAVPIVVVEKEEEFTGVCREDWYDKCKLDSDCCSNSCYNNRGKWPNGICRPDRSKKTTNFNFMRHLAAIKEPRKLIMKSNCDKEFRKQMLKLHNFYRPLHAASDLKSSTKLEKIAQLHSLNIAKKDSQLFHSQKATWGENLAAYHNTNCTELAENMFYQWYNENRNYDFINGDYLEKTADFTQLVWKVTNSIGCAVSCNIEKCFGVCNYSPTGNVGGRFTENVSPNIYTQGRMNYYTENVEQYYSHVQ